MLENEAVVMAVVKVAAALVVIEDTVCVCACSLRQ